MLTAGTGAGDTSKGGTGAETISALGTGVATIAAGNGTDLYALTSGNRTDLLIQNFKSGRDFLSLNGFASGAATTARSHAINSGGSESLTLADGTPISFQNFTGLTGANFL